MPQTTTPALPAPTAPHQVDMPGHEIRLALGPHPLGGSGITAQVECHAGPDALCWYRGPHGGGPAWITGPIPEYLLIPADRCAVTVHLDGTALYRYDGPATDGLRSGPIDVTYRPGDGYAWRYPQDGAGL